MCATGQLYSRADFLEAVMGVSTIFWPITEPSSQAPWVLGSSNVAYVSGQF